MGDRALPSRLVWFYSLIAVSVACVGAAAGNLYWAGDFAISHAYNRTLTLCDRSFPYDLTSGPATAPAEHASAAGYFRCVAGAERVHGLVMLDGVLVALVVAAALVYLVPWLDLGRLRGQRRLPGLSIPSAEQRFAALSAEYRLTGRRSPRLLLASAPVRQPFTIALPGRRPLVVVPLALALPGRDQADFDAVVHHELGHVLARDGAWVSIVRGLTWLALPLVVVAGIPALLGSEFPTVTRVPQVPVAVGTRAAVLAIVMSVLSAALLRRREYAADRFALATGNGPALARLLRTAGDAPVPRRRGRRPGGWFRLFGRHPSAAARLRALAVPDPPDDATTLQGLVTGGVAAIVMGTTTPLVSHFDDGTPPLPWRLLSGLPTGVAAVAGAAVLAGFVPAMRRRSLSIERAGPAGWWRPVAGLAVGVLFGQFIAAGQGLAFGQAFPTYTNGLPTAVALAAVTALTCAGAACLLIGCLPAGLRPLSAYLVGVVVLTGALGSLAGLAWGAALSRAWGKAVLTWYLPDQISPYLLLVLPLLAAVPAVGAAHRGRRGSAVPSRPGPPRFSPAQLTFAVGATVAAGLICAVHSRLVSATTDAQQVRHAEGNAWICAVTSWLVVVLLARRSGKDAVLRALVVGWSVAPLAGAIVLLNTELRGLRPDLWSAWFDVGTPLAWSIVLSVLTAPAVVLLPRIGFRHRHRPVWTPTVVALLVPGLTAALVLSLGTRALYASRTMPTDAASTHLLAARPAPRRAVVGSPRPHEIPTTAGLLAASRAVGADLPDYWDELVPPPAVPTPAATTSPTPTTSPTTSATPTTAITPTTSAAAITPARYHPAEPAACRPLATGSFLPQLPGRPVATATTRYQTRADATTLTRSYLTVGLTSYSTAVPASYFDGARSAQAACHGYTQRSGALMNSFDLRSPAPTSPSPAPSAPAPSGSASSGSGQRVSAPDIWRVDYDTAVWNADYRLPQHRLPGHWTSIMIAAGHTVVTISYNAYGEPSAEPLIQAAVTDTLSALARVTAP